MHGTDSQVWPLCSITRHPFCVSSNVHQYGAWKSCGKVSRDEFPYSTIYGISTPVHIVPIGLQYHTLILFVNVILFSPYSLCYIIVRMCARIQSIYPSRLSNKWLQTITSVSRGCRIHRELHLWFKYQQIICLYYVYTNVIVLADESVWSSVRIVRSQR